MAQFKGGKYSENGVLSYNYLGGKGGKGKGGVSIKKRGDSWYFVDEQGKVKNALGNGGKLTSTHMQNLERDGIFKNAKVNPDTGGEYAKGTEIVSKPGDNVGIDSSGNLSDGSASVQPSLAESNYELPGEMSLDATPLRVKDDFKTIGNPNAEIKTRQITKDLDPPTLQSGLGRGRDFDNKMIGSGYAEYTLPKDNLPISTSSDTTFSPSSVATGFSEGNNSNIPSNYTTGWSQSSPSGTPGNVNIPPGEFEGNYRSMSIPSENFDVSKPQQNMTSSPFSDVTPVDAMQEGTTTPGIVDQKDDSPWGTAAGWDAAGSVMKGVGGLASAWTGIQNYKLARDAHNTQKNQWQANYNQRLKAYADNKVIANNEIAARNRTLAARGQAESYNTI